MNMLKVERKPIEEKCTTTRTTRTIMIKCMITNRLIKFNASRGTGSWKLAEERNVRKGNSDRNRNA